MNEGKAGIEIGNARGEDREALRDLASRAIVHSLPERKANAVAQVARRAEVEMDSLLDMSLDPMIELHIGVARDEEARLLGYIIVDFDYCDSTTGEPQSFIVDLAVKEENWNLGIAHGLVNWARALSEKKGYAAMMGEVSATNEKTLKAALRLGFKIERYQIVLEL